MALQAAPALGARSCSYRIIPTPRTISENRAVLRLLQCFGDVNTFKNFKKEPKLGGRNSGMVIFRDAAVAKDVLERSPIYGWLVDEGRRTDDWGQLKLAKALGPGIKAVLEGDDEARHLSTGAVLDKMQQLNETLAETDLEVAQADAVRYEPSQVRTPTFQEQDLEGLWPDETLVQGPVEANRIGRHMNAGRDEVMAAGDRPDAKSSRQNRDPKQHSQQSLSTVQPDSDPFDDASPLSTASTLWQSTPHRRNPNLTKADAIGVYDPSERHRKYTTTQSQHASPARQFKLVLEPWRGNHADYIERTRFYNKFEPNVVDPMHGDLVRKVPFRGLSDVAIYAGRGFMNYRLEQFQKDVDRTPSFSQWMRSPEANTKSKVATRPRTRLSLFNKG